MPKQASQLGQRGEQRATELLERRGFRILERNVHNKYGEIDIIAIKNGQLHFVEVKTRSGQSYGSASESLTTAKQIKLWRTVQQYLQTTDRVTNRYQIDLMTIEKKSGHWQTTYHASVVEEPEEPTLPNTY